MTPEGATVDLTLPRGLYFSEVMDCGDRYAWAGDLGEMLFVFDPTASSEPEVVGQFTPGDEFWPLACNSEVILGTLVPYETAVLDDDASHLAACEVQLDS